MPAGMELTGMEFGLLGPLMVRRGGTEVPVPSERQRVVLAALLLNAGRVASVDELAEVVWGQAPPRSARVAVQNYVMRLRRSLGGGVGQDRIKTQCGGYRLRVESGELDVTRFEEMLATARAAVQAGSWPTAAGQARAALALWRGEPLADMHSDLLATREVPRLSELRLQAMELRIDADLHQGRHAEVIAETQALAARHPLRERLHWLLMLALYRDGRQAEALAAYQAARTVLIEELGVEPGPGLAKMHHQILNGDPALQFAPVPRPTARAGPPQSRRMRPSATAGTDISAVLADLTGQASAAAPGTVVIVVIDTGAGPVGPRWSGSWAGQLASLLTGQPQRPKADGEPGWPPAPGSSARDLHQGDPPSGDLSATGTTPAATAPGVCPGQTARRRRQRRIHHRP